MLAVLTTSTIAVEQRSAGTFKTQQLLIGYEYQLTCAHHTIEVGLKKSCHAGMKKVTRWSVLTVCVKMGSGNTNNQKDKMKLKETEIKDLVRKPSADGLFTTELRYKVAEASGELNYTGPKIPHEVWQQILSFFKWTYDTTQSESQVRLFVSPRLGTWKAWAFPQQAEMGLSTKELDTEDSRKQRAELFENHDDWTAWGTVHHHCGISAFQSGTDKHDEKNVGGLHITVGDMDKPQHSIHARLYHQGDEYEPDMSKFWDIGDVIGRCPQELLHLMPLSAGDSIARAQMCIPSSVPFPDQWKVNLIKIERNTGRQPWDWETKPLPDPKTLAEGSVEWFGGDRYTLKNGTWVKEPWELAHGYNHQPSTAKDAFERTRDAVTDIESCLAMYNMELPEIAKELEELLEDDLAETIIDTCSARDVTLEDILDEVKRRLANPAAQGDGKEQLDPNWYGVD